MSTSSLSYAVLVASLGVLLGTSTAKSETGAPNATHSGGTQGLQEQMYEDRMKELQAAPSAQENRKPQGMRDSGSSGSQALGSGTSEGASRTPKTPSKGGMGGASSKEGDAQQNPPTK
jgi:hypothetical protein